MSKPKQFIFKCYDFPTAFDMCSILDTFDDVDYFVTPSYSPGKFDPGHFEYEIRYSYVIEGDDGEFDDVL